MQNIISLDHRDIDKAIKDYISSQGVTLDNKHIDIKFTSGRGPNAVNSASVTVTNTTEVTTDADATKSTEKEPEVVNKAKETDVVTESENQAEAKEEMLDDDQPAETKETLVVEDEPKSDDDDTGPEPSDTKSLFGGK